MFDSSKVVPEFKNLLGFRQFHDANQITLPPALTTTVTGEYYQQKHSAIQLDIIQALIPANLTLEKYLTDTVTDATNEILNDVLKYRKLKEYGKTLLEQSVLLNRYGWNQDLIVNQGRFVGFQIRVKSLTGLKMVINEIGFQFSAPEPALKMYLFHTSKSAPIDTFDINVSGNGSWSWHKKDIQMSAFKSGEYHGGAFVLGYYQNDLAGSAVNYSNFNWDTGVCGSCNDPHLSTWRSIRNHFHIYPLYVPAGSYTVGQMFDFQKAIFAKSESYGMNLKMTVQCDLTDFFIQNKFTFKDLLGWKVIHRILNDMKFSQQINNIEENIKMMVIRDLEGDVDTKLTNIPSLYWKELKSVAFDISGINSKCLGCESDATAPQFGVM